MEQIKQVKCIDNKLVEPFLTIGKIYKVLKFHSGAIEVVNDYGSNHIFDVCRFEEITPNNKETNYIKTSTTAIDPKHYQLPIEPKDFIIKNELGFCEGNVIKYICRYKQKNGVEDLKKAKQYIDFLIETYENK